MFTGLFNVSLPLQETNIHLQSSEDIETVFNSIVKPVDNLDRISRTLCQELDHFVLFLSLSCGRGTKGHGNYAMAHSMCQRICLLRYEQDLPALAVQFGPIETDNELPNPSVCICG